MTQSIIDWSKSNILQIIDNPNFVVLSNIWNGDSPNTFQGVVILSNEPQYPVGEYSTTWHKNKFELVEDELTLTFSNKQLK
jgi:hypothetical protein